MKSIVNEYLLTSKRKDNEILHLITCEDPVENWVSPDVKKTEANPALEISDFLRKQGIVYTPRNIGADVKDIAQALKDAKRQTPACYVVGEVRDAKDWNEVIDFASTGHLIVVTTHASSVREAILKIFKAMKVHRAQERRQIANSLLAVVHAELIGVKYKTGDKKRAQQPMCWLRDASSVNQLTVDGFRRCCQTTLSASDVSST